MSSETTRRDFLIGGTAASAGLLAGGAVEPLAAQQPQPGGGTEYPRDRAGAGGAVGTATDRGKLVPGRRRAADPPVPVEAPDLTRLPWRMNNGVKEFRLVCQHTRREFLPDLLIDVWGYNGSMPGPTIEAVEGDRVRIIVENRLPESTTVHWHGLDVPIAMDGVHGVVQEPIRPGQTFTYEFTLHQNGTFFYHSHGPMQEAIGMVGLFIVYPRTAYQPQADHDFALVVQEWAILPGSTIPNTMSMEFNFFTINGRSAPFTTPLLVRLGNRARIRFLNFSTIDHHPMHLHGHTFWVTGTEGGRIPESAWIPGNNVLVGVAQVREVEFIANNPGDWMIHCHMFHHMMNSMSSMVGPMGGHTRRGTEAGLSMNAGMGIVTRGPALSPEFGPSLGRGMGEQTGADRTVGNGPHGGQGGHGQPGGHGQHGAALVPGFPQDMMDMPSLYTPAQIRRLNKPQTRGMRRNWYEGSEGLMTIVRVLPPDLYDRVVSGRGEVREGESVPGAAAPGAHPGHNH